VPDDDDEDRVRRLDARSADDAATATTLLAEFDRAIGVIGATATTRRLFDAGAAHVLVVEGPADRARTSWTVRGVVASARETPALGIVNAVYTRPAHRRRGVARRAVAAMADRILETKARVALYADADADGPNRLYRSLGFVAVASLHTFKPPAGDDAPPAPPAVPAAAASSSSSSQDDDAAAAAAAPAPGGGDPS